MTVILRSLHAGKSKAALKVELESRPELVIFEDPSIMNPRVFRGSEIKSGETFVAVLDHPKRYRFAEITKSKDGSWKVK